VTVPKPGRQPQHPAGQLRRGGGGALPAPRRADQVRLTPTHACIFHNMFPGGNYGISETMSETRLPGSNWDPSVAVTCAVATYAP